VAIIDFVAAHAATVIAADPNVRPTRHILLVCAGIVAAVGLVPVLYLSAPTAPPLPPPEQAHEIVVLIRPGPVVYFQGPDGTQIGFDADLLQLFAAQMKLPLRFVTAGPEVSLFARLSGGYAHIGAGGLLRPPPAAAPAKLEPPPKDEPPADADDTAADPLAGVRWSTGYYAIEPLLICNSDGYKPAGWADLAGEVVAYIDGTGLEPEVEAVKSTHPRVMFRPLELPSPASLIAQVSDGTINYAIVGSLAAAVARNVYVDYEVAFAAGPKREVAWAVSARFPALQQELDRFLERAKRDGTIARLAARYLPDARQFQRVDASAFLDSVRSLLPQWRAIFHDAQEHTDIEWRLLAAIAYQESKWDPYATSETGVRGFMQITEETARHLGIKDRLDPGQAVLGAARYLRDLKAKLPKRIPEPDRTWLALAAFNIGLGHLEDARVLAQRQRFNPDSWSDVKKVLPLLALPEYHVDAKNGYARGGMPVAFVDRVRSYYDVLLAHQPAMQPRLRMAAEFEGAAPAAK
jgi:membrane-bound lytic murein transglycosylase F